MNLFLSRRTMLALSGAAILAPGAARAQPASEADAAFDALAADAIKAFARLNPTYATQLGDHDFDAWLDDLSPQGYDARATFARETLTALNAIPAGDLDRERQVDAAMLRSSLEGQIWTYETLRDWTWDPLTHNGVAGGSLYNLIARDYAPASQRLMAAASRMERFPALFAGTRASLQPDRVPSIHAQTYVNQNRGVLGLIDLLMSQAEGLSEAETARLTAAATVAREAINSHQAWIEQTLLPSAQADFRIGAELYDRKLQYALNSPLDRAAIRQKAETAMETITAEMYGLAQGVLAGRADAPALPASPSREERRAAIAAALELAYAERPARDQVVPLARETLETTTAFVRAHDLVSVPDDPVQIILMPEFQRGVAVAYCDSPGPLDRGQDTFYAVSPIPDDWTEEQVASFLREYNTRSIHELTIHEAMPGHYLQIAHSNRHPSVLRAVLSSGPFVEGWACYVQDVMDEAGYMDRDPLYRLVHLKWQLRMIANAILDQAIHVDGMTREAAMELMMRDAFQEEREAAGKWVRAQLSSTQLPTYFVGWDEHWSLRREVEAREGAAFNLKAYHDRALSFGSPPVRYTRALMLGEQVA